ncbi:hypothetical protein HCU40_00725 [Pseudanabaena biceps]|nr:hypothetical protein [Pseudanabaena biceps]
MIHTLSCNAQNGKHAIASNLIDGIGFGTTEFHVVRPSSEILAEWVHKFLRQPKILNSATELFTGSVGQQRVPESFIGDLEIPLPPLPEQKRILAILNEQMSGVEKARAAAEAQLQAAKTLTAAYLREVFDSPEAQKWERKTLGDICRDISDGSHFTPTYISKGIPFLSVKDVKETGISFNDCRYISEEQHKDLCRRCKPEIGDVLYTKVGTTGIAKSVDVEREFSIFVSVALLKLTPQVLPDYLEKILNSPLCRVQSANLTQGAANRNLVIRDIKRITLPLPPLEVQQHLVTVITEDMTNMKHLQRSLQDQLNTIKQLPAALLRQAFNGEL